MAGDRSDHAGDGTLVATVGESLDGERLDRALALLAGVSRQAAAALVAAGEVRVDGAVVRTRSRLLRVGQRLVAVVPASHPGGLVPDPDIAFAVVHADDDIVVVDKPSGLVVHHGAGHTSGTLIDGLVARFPDLLDLGEAGVCDPARPGLVHRLDRDASGLLVVARSAAAFASLAEQFRSRRAARRYVVLVEGLVEDDAGEVDAPVGRPAGSLAMAVTEAGRPARTSYRVVGRIAGADPATLLEVALATGRTHQIRVHMAAIGHPVVGDPTYGRPRPGGRRPAGADTHGLGRLFLHAYELEIDHPTGGRRRFTSDLPDELGRYLERRAGAPSPAGDGTA